MLRDTNDNTSAPGPDTVAPAAPAAAREMPDVLGLTANDYADWCESQRLPGGRVGAYERYINLFHHGLLDQRHLTASIAPITRTHTSQCAEGTTLKFTQRVPRLPAGGADHPADTLARSLRLAPSAPDTLETESVLIPMIGRKGVLTYTLCVSSQVGCAMGCTFCQTAQMGLIRSLTPAEIVGQWFAATHLLKHHVSNIVFMGMGEPLDNFENAVKAIAILTDRRGGRHPMRKTVVSTVGRLDGLRRLADQVRTPEWHRLNLAVSLNAPSDEIRSQIMPINRAMPIAELRRALESWPIYGGAKICLEYVLIPGVNDQQDHARQVAAFVLGREAGPEARAGGIVYDGPRLPVLVNLIPYNPRDNSPWSAPDEIDVEMFVTWLLGAGAYAKRRRTKGRDTMAACGQLGNPEIRRRGSPK